MGIPLLLYVLLCFSGVQNKLRATAQTELSQLLGAKVEISRLEVIPFSRIELKDATVTLRQDTLLKAGEINAGISLHNLLLRRRIVVTDVELMNPDIRVWRQDSNSPLNIAPVIEKLKGDGSKKENRFALAIYTVVVRGGRASYNVVNEPPRDGFDPNHISLHDIRADLTVPRISNNEVSVNLKRLNFTDRSGLTLRNMAAEVCYTPDTLKINGLDIRMPNSRLSFADAQINLAKESDRITEIELMRGSVLYPSDFKPLVSQAEAIPGPLSIRLRAAVFRDSLNLQSLHLEVPERLNVAANASAAAGHARLPMLDFGVKGEDIAMVANAFKPLPSSTMELLKRLGEITFSGNASWKKPADIIMSGLLTCDAATAEFQASLESGRLTGVADIPTLMLNEIFPGKQLGEASLAADFNLSKSSGSANLAVDKIQWRGHDFSDIVAAAQFNDKTCEATLAINDTLISTDISAIADLTPGNYSASLNADIRHIDPNALNLWNKYPGYRLGAEISAEFMAAELMKPAGTLTISGIHFRNDEGDGLRLAPIKLETDLHANEQFINLSSDLIDLHASGQINLPGLATAGNNLLAEALPQYFAKMPTDSAALNDFEFSGHIKETSPIFTFAKPAIKPLYHINFGGILNQSENIAAISLEAPYLQKDNKLIHATRLAAIIGEETSMDGHMTMPSKQGDTEWNLSATLNDGIGNINLDWRVDCEADYSGEIMLSAVPLQQGADIRILPGHVTFNNAKWTIEPTFIGIRNGAAVINNLNITRPGQEATISGVVSRHPADRLSVSLNNINLDYIFDTLQLGPAIMFGGQATGTVQGSGLLSGEPVLQTNDLFVRNFSYGQCVMGNANIRSRWNKDSRGIEIRANIPGNAPDALTLVDGMINPLNEELEFVFQARHSPVGFLKPIMATFATDVKGTASGSCHLFGDFKNVNLEGDMLAENFAITIGFTGVTYQANDSIHIVPGEINIPPITVKDSSGHTGIFSGQLRHNYFKDCTFDFHINNAKSLLVYDLPENPDTPWYGKVRGTGSASIAGETGYVKISAAMATAEGTEFAFSLSDSEKAAEYNFLTFRDVTPTDAADSLPPAPGSPELHKIMMAKIARQQQLAEASNYDFDFQIDVTPEAKMILVMDPNAGDKITANGAGHVGILYGSANEELRMYGDYRISRGEYNFSLQDIILKNFSIRDGSVVSFHGDPMDANLNIAAIYQLNANLSDLDESFLNDKEVQRTNVPVYAVLKVDGSIQDPQISFDLDFPTLSSDVKRKVASIVSTEEMMNRQIIYLLALNRFYTPDYMNATKGNELASVATGTISSQLSNILGQLSDKISVAPSVRSDAGDFSDVEFDVALSSTLLNNRLLLNGNFGYRDKSLNNNQFIGDFDVEYLLTRAGNWRLKAYNHFNDRNLYVKTSLTTQGIGIVFKHDFDHLFRPRKNQKTGERADSTSRL